MDDSFDLVAALGHNSFIPCATIQSNGPPSRPLEFPAPTVDTAVTVSADCVDHRTGNLFRATSVLMRRPVHASCCPRGARTTSASRATPSIAHGATFDATTSRAVGRVRTPERIHSWHSAFNLPSSSLATDALAPKKHRKILSLSSSSCTQNLCQCDHSCELPDRAYCVLRRLCDTTYGSVRLCVVLKRVKRQFMDYTRNASPANNPHRRIRNEELLPEWETTDEMVAIKVVNWSKLQSFRGRHLEDPIKELAALQQLVQNRHRNIVSILEALQNETHLFCVFPYIAGGDLCGCVLDRMSSSPTGRLAESLARTWFRQLLFAITHLQKKGICHRDISLENIMVDEDNNIQLIDFGLCLRVPYEDPNNRNLVTDVSANTSRRVMKAQGQCGDFGYMAPEMAKREAFDGFAIDLWGAGIVLFELLIGRKPYSIPDPVDQNFQLVSVEGKLDELLHAKEIVVSNEAVDLLQKMLWHDPVKRLSLSEIVHHPWLQGLSGVDASWFIKSNSIFDEMESAKSTSPLFDGHVDDRYSRSYTAESMTSTMAEDREAPKDDTLNGIDAQKRRRWLSFGFKWRGVEKAVSML